MNKLYKIKKSRREENGLNTVEAWLSNLRACKKSLEALGLFLKTKRHNFNGHAWPHRPMACLTGLLWTIKPIRIWTRGLGRLKDHWARVRLQKASMFGIWARSGLLFPGCSTRTGPRSVSKYLIKIGFGYYFYLKLQLTNPFIIYRIIKKRLSAYGPD